MAVVSPTLTINTSPKDSRWLTLEVCREFQRNKCTRTDEECKFAHPPAHVDSQNGRVIACFDYIKGKCQRKDPPCKYLHPPQHLREQLLQNGRNNLIMKSIQLQSIQQQFGVPMIPVAAPGKPVAYQAAILPAQIPYLAPQQYFSSIPSPVSGIVPQFATPYGLPAVAIQAGIDGSMVAQQMPAVVSPGQLPTKGQLRADRLEVCREFQRGSCSRQPGECRYAHPNENVALDGGDSLVMVCMDYVRNRCSRDSCKYFHPPDHLQSQIRAAAQLQRANGFLPPSASAVAADQTMPAQVLEVMRKKRARDPVEDLILPQMNFVPPFKRVAMDCSNSSLGRAAIPIYHQPAAGAIAAAQFHQTAPLMHLQHQSIIPVTYSGEMIQQAYPSIIQQGTAIVGGAARQSHGVEVTRAPVLFSPAFVTSAATVSVGINRSMVSNASPSNTRIDLHSQLQDTLPLCLAFDAGLCRDARCRKAHVVGDVKTTADGLHVVVCRDAMRNACNRLQCKYYHLPPSSLLSL